MPSLVLCLILASSGSSASVVINEIMYNTPGTPDVEYVELLNTGPGAVDVGGWHLLDDDDSHPPCVLSGTLEEGEYLVVAGRFDLFSAAYPGVTALNPTSFDGVEPGAGFGLGNTTDRVRLFDLGGALVDEVEYADGGEWPTQADGDGPSLELRNPSLDNDLAAGWAASVNASPPGTPGAVNSVYVADTPPLVGDVARDIPLPTHVDPVSVTAAVEDDGPISGVDLWVDGGEGFDATPMLDDGLHDDGDAADGVFGATISARPRGTLVRYYVEATDTLPQSVTAPAGAPEEYFAYTVDHQLPSLRISEILASNQNGLIDGAGDTDDWIEIRNAGPDDVYLAGLFLSDDLDDSTRWPIPATLIRAGESLIAWCDDEPMEGPFHVAFTLQREGGEIGLFDSVDHGNVLIDGYPFGPQSPDVSYGYFPDDADTPEYLEQPTPGSPNEFSELFSPICINEFLAGSQLPSALDWVELLNRGDAMVDIGGWHLSDDPAEPARYTFPAGAVIPPGGRLVVNSDDLGFGLAAGGEMLVLSSVSAQTGRDFVDFGPQFDDVSRGRYPEGAANWHFFGSPTPGSPNGCVPGIPQLDPVAALRFDSPTAMRWEPVAGATAYDTVRGDLPTLRASGGDYAAASVGCLENNGDLAAWTPEDPPVGGGFFFLSRGVDDACGFGTWDSASSAQAASRDAAIDAAADACP